MSDSIVHLSSKNIERSFCTSVPVWRSNAQFELKRELRMGITGILSIKISKYSDFVTYVMMLVWHVFIYAVYANELSGSSSQRRAKPVHILVRLSPWVPISLLQRVTERIRSEKRFWYFCHDKLGLGRPNLRCHVPESVYWLWRADGRLFCPGLGCIPEEQAANTVS